MKFLFIDEIFFIQIFLNTSLHYFLYHFPEARQTDMDLYMLMLHSLPTLRFGITRAVFSLCGKIPH